jgi:hypothetical protein
VLRRSESARKVRDQAGGWLDDGRAEHEVKGSADDLGGGFERDVREEMSRRWAAARDPEDAASG